MSRGRTEYHGWEHVREAGRQSVGEAGMRGNDYYSKQLPKSTTRIEPPREPEMEPLPLVAGVNWREAAERLGWSESKMRAEISARRVHTFGAGYTENVSLDEIERLRGQQGPKVRR